MSTLNLILLYGGKSGEHEVSLESAASVLHALNPQKYKILPIAIDKHGEFHLHQYEDLLSAEKALPVTSAKSKKLPSLTAGGGLAVHADVIFPVVHGPLYEDGCLQGLFELANVAYVGCDVLSSAIGMDKDMTRRILAQRGIRSARYRRLTWDYPSSERASFASKVALELGFPLFVKPCSLGSSVGIRKATHLNELVEAIQDALRYDEEILVEEGIPAREIELAVLENATAPHKPRVSLVGEIQVQHPDGFYSYNAKYINNNDTKLVIPAALSTAQGQQLQQLAATIFTELKCKGMARIDFFIHRETNVIYFNEINTIPGFTSISMYPKLWQESGLNYPDLLDELIQLARTHHERRQHLVTDYS
jgi:D-alanine-D-alanine ligase